MLYRGFDITRARDKELTQYRRRHVGFVFQFYNLIPSLTALENVAAVTAVITHNADIAGMADRVVHMSNGNVSHVDLNANRRNLRELHW